MLRPLLLACLLAAAALAGAAPPSTGTLLALLQDPADRSTRFGPFFDGLESAGWTLDVRSAKPSGDPVKLRTWDGWAYDGVVVLPGTTNGEEGWEREQGRVGAAGADADGFESGPILLLFFFSFAGRPAPIAGLQRHAIPRDGKRKTW